MSKPKLSKWFYRNRVVINRVFVGAGFGGFIGVLMAAVVWIAIRGDLGAGYMCALILVGAVQGILHNDK